jgi:NhaP-type Na+/H+ or K+/H+ antiporter
VFGESLIKDAVTIVLYKSIERLVIANGQTDQFEFYWYTTLVILATFVVMIIVSILIGFICAILLTLIFKYARFILKDKGITEVGLLFLTGYISYLASELLGFSGVITMLFCGITLSHFNTYNMSPQGVAASKYISLLMQGHLRDYIAHCGRLSIFDTGNCLLASQKHIR